MPERPALVGQWPAPFVCVAALVQQAHAPRAADREGTERRRAAPDFRSVRGLCPPRPSGLKRRAAHRLGGLRAALWAAWLGETMKRPLTAWHRGGDAMGSDNSTVGVLLHRGICCRLLPSWRERGACGAMGKGSHPALGLAGWLCTGRFPERCEPRDEVLWSRCGSSARRSYAVD